MSQLNPSPRKAVVAFGVTMTQAIINALGTLIAEGGTPWDAEDALYAYRDLTPADRVVWSSLEVSLANQPNAVAALVLAEGMAGGVAQGQPANPSNGTEADVLAVWAAHAATNPGRRARLRALSRVIASRESPSATLAALAAAVAALPGPP